MAATLRRGYTIGSATASAWVLTEWSGVDATPYDIANGQFASSSGGTYTTPAIVPTTGNRLLIAAQGASNSSGNLSGDMTTWLNSFTHVAYFRAGVRRRYGDRCGIPAGDG